MSAVVITNGKRPLNIITRATDSIINQEMKPATIILVDSSRSPSIRKMCESCGITYIGVSNHINGPEKRNIGADHCNSKYIGFLDDDDEWFPEKIKQQMELADSNPSIICSNYIIQNNNKTKTFHQFEQYSDNKNNILQTNYVGSTSFPLILKQTFDELGGFDPKFKSNQEWDLWIRILKEHEVAHTPYVVGIKYETTNSISKNRRARTSGWIRILSKHSEEYIKNPQLLKKATDRFVKESKRNKSIIGIFAGYYYSCKYKKYKM